MSRSTRENEISSTLMPTKVGAKVLLSHCHLELKLRLEINWLELFTKTLNINDPVVYFAKKILPKERKSLLKTLFASVVCIQLFLPRSRSTQVQVRWMLQFSIVSVTRFLKMFFNHELFWIPHITKELVLVALNTNQVNRWNQRRLFSQLYAFLYYAEDSVNTGTNSAKVVALFDFACCHVWLSESVQQSVTWRY